MIKYDMIKKILTLSKQLISIPSTKESPKELQKTLDLTRQHLQDCTIEEFEKDGIKSILAYTSKTRPKRFKIILNAHLDVVPGKNNQFSPVEKNGKLYGRGTYDMKSAAAVLILLFKEIAGKVKYPLALQLVTDEEIGGFNGTKYQIEQGVIADFIIAGENTDLAIINEAKGIIWAKIVTTGAAAHGAYPWLGDNAIVKMNLIINKILEHYPIPLKEAWKTTVNFSSIETTNKTFNKVPDNCITMLDIRYVPEDDNLIVPFLKQFKKKETQIEIILKEPCYFTEKNNQLITKLNQSIKIIIGNNSQILPHHGGSDIRHFNLVGCKGIEFGPLGKGHHTDNEWVDIKSLEDYYNILKDFLLKL